MKMKTKTLDAVALKRQGAQRIYEEIANLTAEQRLAYWEDANRRLVTRQRAIRRRKAKA